MAEASKDAGLGDREEAWFLPPPTAARQAASPLAGFICEAGVLKETEQAPGVPITGL